MAGWKNIRAGKPVEPCEVKYEINIDASSLRFLRFRKRHGDKVGKNKVV
jgi:hypothetical protein